MTCVRPSRCVTTGTTRARVWRYRVSHPARMIRGPPGSGTWNHLPADHESARIKRAPPLEQEAASAVEIARPEPLRRRTQPGSPEGGKAATPRSTRPVSCGCSQPRHPLAQDPQRHVHVGRPEVKPEQDRPLAPRPSAPRRGRRLDEAARRARVRRAASSGRPYLPRKRTPPARPDSLGGPAAERPRRDRPASAPADQRGHREQTGQHVLAPGPRQEIEADHERPEGARVERGPAPPDPAKTGRCR